MRMHRKTGKTFKKKDDVILRVRKRNGKVVLNLSLSLSVSLSLSLYFNSTTIVYHLALPQNKKTTSPHLFCGPHGKHVRSAKSHAVKES